MSKVDNGGGGGVQLTPPPKCPCNIFWSRLLGLKVFAYSVLENLQGILKYDAGN